LNPKSLNIAAALRLIPALPHQLERTSHYALLFPVV
jgi:hypothetical protein